MSFRSIKLLAIFLAFSYSISFAAATIPSDKSDKRSAASGVFLNSRDGPAQEILNAIENVQSHCDELYSWAKRGPIGTSFVDNYLSQLQTTVLATEKAAMVAHTSPRNTLDAGSDIAFDHAFYRLHGKCKTAFDISDSFLGAMKKMGHMKEYTAGVLATWDSTKFLQESVHRMFDGSGQTPSANTVHHLEGILELLAGIYETMIEAEKASNRKC